MKIRTLSLISGKELWAIQETMKKCFKTNSRKTVSNLSITVKGTLSRFCACARV